MRRQRERTKRCSAPPGRTVWIDDEARMDAVTAVSGSGPAYVFLLAEAMQAAGEAEGLPPEAARTLALQTILGAARMLAESESSAARTATPRDLAERHHPGGDRNLRGRRLPRTGRSAPSTPPRVRGKELSAAND